jgi:hypothetical protein
MTPESILVELLKQTNPSALLWVAGAGVVAKFGMDLLKRSIPSLQGNLVQTATFLVSLAAAVVQAAIAGVFSGGVTGQEVGSILIVGALTYLGAVGVNETLKNTNPKAESDLKAALVADAAKVENVGV